MQKQVFAMEIGDMGVVYRSRSYFLLMIFIIWQFHLFVGVTLIIYTLAARKMLQNILPEAPRSKYHR